MVYYKAPVELLGQAYKVGHLKMRDSNPCDFSIKEKTEKAHFYRAQKPCMLSTAPQRQLCQVDAQMVCIRACPVKRRPRGT